MAKLAELRIRTTWGQAYARVEDGRLVQFDLPKVNRMPAQGPRVVGHAIKAGNARDRRVLLDTLRFVRDALQGRQRRRPPMAPKASGPFVHAAWNALKRVPPGKTVSYAELAARAGRPRAVRAAGQACATNPLPLFVPCHRVLASGGGLGGFSCGLAWKVHLLESERPAQGAR